MMAAIVWNEGTLAVLLIFSLPIVAVIAGVWRKTEQSRAELDLKRSMVERGMSADEIERVIAARPSEKIK